MSAAYERTHMCRCAGASGAPAPQIAPDGAVLALPVEPKSKLRFMILRPASVQRLAPLGLFCFVFGCNDGPSHATSLNPASPPDACCDSKTISEGSPPPDAAPEYPGDACCNASAPPFPAPEYPGDACCGDFEFFPDAGAIDGNDLAIDATVSDASDGDAAGEANAGEPTQDASDAEPGDAACPASWYVAPSVPAALALPGDAGNVPVLLRAYGVGTQNYACQELADGGTAWSFVGPEAKLEDCSGASVGQHFASVAGTNPPPEWVVDDGGYAIGSKIAAYTPDGGASAVPWLLLGVTSKSDAGTLSRASYVRRLNTTGGLMPTAECIPDGGIEEVPYSADYFFYGD